MQRREFLEGRRCRNGCIGGGRAGHRAVDAGGQVAA